MTQTNSAIQFSLRLLFEAMFVAAIGFMGAMTLGNRPLLGEDRSARVAVGAVIGLACAVPAGIVAVLLRIPSILANLQRDGEFTASGWQHFERPSVRH